MIDVNIDPVGGFEFGRYYFFENTDFASGSLFFTAYPYPGRRPARNAMIGH